MSLVPRIDLPLEVIANVVPKGNEQIVIPGLHVGRNYLTLPEPTVADQVATYEILAWVFAAGRDKPVGIIQRTITYDLAKDPEARKKLKANGFVFVPADPLTLPPGAYQIRAVVREKTTGSLGTSYQFFEVPDAANTKAASLSSIVITPAGETSFSGTNSFKRGAEIDLRFVIYNLPKDTSALEQKISLMDEHGTTLMSAVLPVSAAGAVRGQAGQATRLNLPVERGHYSVLVTLNNAKGKLALERRADFVIE